MADFTRIASEPLVKFILGAEDKIAREVENYDLLRHAFRQLTNSWPEADIYKTEEEDV